MPRCVGTCGPLSYMFVQKRSLPKPARVVLSETNCAGYIKLVRNGNSTASSSAGNSRWVMARRSAASEGLIEYTMYSSPAVAWVPFWNGMLFGRCCFTCNRRRPSLAQCGWKKNSLYVETLNNVAHQQANRLQRLSSPCRVCYDTSYMHCSMSPQVFFYDRFL